MSPYDTLGVRRDASPEEIRVAYRRLAAQYHPDKHMNNPLSDLAAEKFRQIQEAYSILSNPQRRAAFDATDTGSRGARAGADSREYTSADYSTESLIHDIEALLERRMYDDVVRKVTIAIDRGSEDARLYAYRGMAYRSQGNMGQAVINVKIAAGRAPGDPGIQELTGSTLIEAGRPRDAVPYIRRAVAQVGEAPDLLALLALALEQSGEAAESKAYWNRVRQIDPSNEILGARGQHWKVGDTYVNKSDSASGACCLCVLVELIFDCC